MSSDLIPDEVRKARAKDLLSQGRIEDARGLLHDLCHDGQKDVETWFLYSAASAHLGRFDDVTVACRRALDLDPTYLPALNSLASALAALGRHHEAAAMFEQAVRQAPENPSVLNNYGHALTLIGRVQEARASLEKAVQIQPFYAEARFNLALLLEQTGFSAEALQEFEKAAELKPGLPGINDRIAHLQKSSNGQTRDNG